MSSVQNLRELINERLTAAAVEIFTEFAKTIVQYEEEIDRQRKLLDNIWKPQITQHTADLPQQQICKEEDNIWQPQITLQTELPQQHDCKEEEVLTEQDVWSTLERNSSVDQEDPKPSQMKEGQGELCSSLNEQQLVPNQKADSFVLVECKSKCEELLGENFLVSENTIGQYEKEIDHQCRRFNITQKLQIKLHKIDLQQQHICMDQGVFTDHLHCNQEKNICLDQKDPETLKNTGALAKLCIRVDQDHPRPPQIEEEQTELSINQGGGQLDTFMGTSTHEESDRSEPEPIGGQFLHHQSCLAESPDQDGSKCPNSGSTNNLVLKKTHDRNNSHSTNVDSSSVSHIYCHADTRKKTQTCDVCGKAFTVKSHLKTHYRIHTGEKPFACKKCGKKFTQSHHVTAHMRTHTDKKLYLCKTCGKRFRGLAAFQRHRAIYKDHSLFSCKICKKGFTRPSHVKVHMKVHTGERPYSCKICGKNFNSRSNLKAHTKIHTGERPYSCQICGQNFIKNSNLKVHMRIHTDERPYSCNTCEKRFRHRRSLLIHMRVHTDIQPQLFCKEQEVLVDHQLCNQERNFSLNQEHLSVKDEQEELFSRLEQEDSEPSQINVEQEKQCSNQERDQLGLKWEADTFMVPPIYEESDHSETEPNSVHLLSHSCPLADQEESKQTVPGLARNVELKPKKTCHRKSSHSNNTDNSSVSESQCDAEAGKKHLTCDVCGRNFKLMFEFKRHYKIHTSVKTFFCGTCGKSFRQSHHLAVHVKTHISEKMYLCNTCGRRFYGLDAFKRHTAIHRDNKPYSCKVCEKVFSHQSSLTFHMMAHSNERPYSCQNCGRKLIRNSHLTAHMRIHTGEKPYSCKTCGKNFSRTDYLLVHMRIHTGEKPYICKTCEKRFNDPSGFKKHLEVHMDVKQHVCNTCGKRFASRSSLTRHAAIHTVVK